MEQITFGGRDGPEKEGTGEVGRLPGQSVISGDANDARLIRDFALLRKRDGKEAP